MRIVLLGATGKLGRSLSKDLAKCGHSLLIHASQKHESLISLHKELVKSGAKVDMCAADFRSDDEVRTLVAEIGKKPFDALICMASIYKVGDLISLPLSDMELMHQVNYLAPLKLLQQLQPKLVEAKARVLFFGVAGLEHKRADLYSPGYGSSLVSLLYAIRSYAKSLISHGVRLNMLSLGYLDASQDQPQNPQNLLFERAISIEEVISWVHHLLSPASSMLTGQNIELSGGTRL